MRGRGGRREAGIQDRHTALRRGEEGGAGMAQRGGYGLAEEKRWQRRRGGVPLTATGAPRPAAQKFWKEQDKESDAQAEVCSVSRPRQKRMDLTG